MDNEALRFEEAHVKRMIDRLRSVLERRIISQRDIVEAADVEKSKLSRWLSGKLGWATIGEEGYARIIEYVAVKRIFEINSYAVPDNVALRDMAFHGLASFFGVDETDLNIARDKLVGYYLAYRYSYYAAPDILRGYIHVTYDEQARTLRTADHYRIPAGSLGPDSPEVNFRRDGYIWPTKLNMYVVVAEKVDKKDIQVLYLNKSLLNTPNSAEDILHTLEGVLLDWQGPDFYVTKIFLQKVASRPDDKLVGLLTERDMPPLVLMKLKETFTGPHKYLRTYK